MSINEYIENFILQGILQVMNKRRKKVLFSKSSYAEQNFRVCTLIKEAPVSKNYFLSAIVPSN